jgi:NADH:ubiquinone oxidoreductase subunit E
MIKADMPDTVDIEDFFLEPGLGRKDLISLLHRVQDRYGFIPGDAVLAIARRLGLTPTEIFGVLTFYKAFTLKPRGTSTVTVCLGTACHVRGGARIVEELERKLGIPAGATTSDRRFTLETVNCLGCCAIGPVVVVNGVYHAHVTLQKIDALLDKYRTAGSPA